MRKPLLKPNFGYARRSSVGNFNPVRLFITRDRIRRIEAKALRKMRHPTRIRKLEGFIELPGA